MRRFTIAGALLLAPAALAAQGMASVAEAVNSITAEDVYNRIAVIADDSMLGRNTPSPELEQTANYIAGQYYSFGLRPMGDAGSYLQRYPLHETGWDRGASHLTVAGNRFGLGEQVQLIFARNSTGEVTGDAVIVHGSLDDRTAMNALDIQGKIAFVVVPTVNGDFVGGPFGPVRTLFRKGAASVILVSDRSDQAFAAQRETLDSRDVSAAWGETRTGGAAFLEMRDRDLVGAFRAVGFDLTEARRNTSGPLAVSDVNLDVSLEVTQRVISRASAPNVVAVLQGSDPELRDEYVVFSAHMDHVGVRANAAGGDSIFNGADDDASGTIAVVELAQAFAMLANAPRRSIIFLVVSGEEKGLWGSEYFSENLPVPAEQIVANLNLDMIGRNWSDTIVAIGKEHSDLGETLNRVNAEHPELGMTAIDDIWPEERFYFRSDHYNFARQGIPILFFFNGTHEDYHGAGDEVDKIGADKEARIIRLNFYLGLEIANQDQRPRWNPESYEEIVNTSE